MSNHSPINSLKIDYEQAVLAAVLPLKTAKSTFSEEWLEQSRQFMTKLSVEQQKNFEKLLADYVILRQSEENQIFADGVHLAHQLMQECYR